MDIFNRKRVEELEKALAEVRRDRYRYMSLAGELKTKFEAIEKLEESIPEDCVRGPWCKACGFVKTYHFTERFGFGSDRLSETIYICGKGESCKNFVQRRE